MRPRYRTPALLHPHGLMPSEAVLSKSERSAPLGEAAPSGIRVQGCNQNLLRAQGSHSHLPPSYTHFLPKDVRVQESRKR